MVVVDLHCDVLYKMALDPKLQFTAETQLDAALPRLQRGQVRLQCFALFVSTLPRPTFYDLLRQIDLWYEKVLIYPEMIPVKTKQDMQNAFDLGRIGSVLTLEGVDGLEGDLTLLRHLYRLGVRIVGLTWNHANWAADGVLEERNGRLTHLGKRLVAECERLGIILDVSHLGEESFWDLMTMASGPIIASHSNCRSICSHPRNLSDQQIAHLISIDGRIGITFVPYFLTDHAQANLSDVIKHLDHICSLGGVHHVGFGSDFDGIDRWVHGLRHSGEYEYLGDQLTKYYKKEEIEGFLWKNNARFFAQHLPASPL